MLNALTVSNYATYKTEIRRLGPLNRINFVFGNNGSGKTSLTRLLCKQETELPAGCCLDWARGNRLVPYVYNVDYVRKNFVASDRIPGVFSLGSEDVTLKKRLDEFDEKISGLTGKISKLTAALDGDDSSGLISARAALNQSREVLVDFFWKNIKVQYDADFRILFEGKRGKRSEFCSLCTTEFQGRVGRRITPVKIDDLKSRALALSDKTLQARSLLPTLNAQSLQCYETAPILEKVIVGRSDIDIASLVASLGNSDWVSNGRSYLHKSHGICPFCQQSLPANFEVSLSQYFDDSYADDIASLKKLKTDYEREAGSLISQFRGYCALCPELKNNQKFCNAGKLLVSTYEKNVAQLQKKILSPSLKIQLEETQGILTEILECVMAENEVIKRDNKLISEREAQTEILRRDFWDFLYVQLGNLFNALNDDLGMAQKQVDGLTKNIETRKDELTQLQKERSAWAALHSNVVPTITAINNQLQRLGFHSFTLAESGGDYALVRPDGAKANETLSEGERTLVTFLYFMERIYGADKGVALREERLVVIDDPISSLDAEVLFVVSSLVRNIMRDVESGSTPLKQMVILTHNIYFQKEITFCPNHDRELRKNRSYFLVTKTRAGSKIEKCDENPVRTSYELLWKDFVREDRDDLSLQNTMRRILEYYFKILGRQNLDELYKRFEGVEQMICKSLISWINDGSHYPGDDLFYSIPNATIELYRNVFQKVFENTGNLPHYEMMMNAVLGCADNSL